MIYEFESELKDIRGEVVRAVLLAGHGHYACDAHNEWMHQDELGDIVGGPSPTGHEFKTFAHIYRSRLFDPDPAVEEEVRIDIQYEKVGVLHPKDVIRFNALSEVLAGGRAVIIASAMVVGGKQWPTGVTRYGVKLDIDWLVPFVLAGDMSGSAFQLSVP